MKRLILFLALSVSSLFAEGLLIQKNDRLAIVGDSITEQKLYSLYIATYLQACTPELNLDICQFGWGGETAPGFASRMDNDLVPWKPNIVTTCYGMNDGRYGPFNEKVGSDYREGMKRIVDRMKEIGAKMVVGGPGAVDTDSFRRENPEFDKVYNDNLKQLSGIAAGLAKESGHAHADVFGTMYEAMIAAKKVLGESFVVCGGDGFHPGPNGHLLMAQAFLKGLGVDGAIGTITWDAATGTAEASEGHKVLTANAQSLELESSRYPFCFFGDEKDPNGTRSIIPFTSFNKDLNRYLLIVKNLKTPKAEITWGSGTKSFTREQLEAGINLADEFIDNPLAPAFFEVQKALAQQQGFETPMIKDQINKFRFFQEQFKDDAEVAQSLSVLREKLQAKRNELQTAARAKVIPVKHTLALKALE
jgi:lysophospholipase L1-like esterase